MKLKEYLENFNKMVAENPKMLDFEVVSASDDEGNDFNKVYWEPTLGIYNANDYERRFISLESLLEEPEEYEYTKDDINAICVN